MRLRIVLMVAFAVVLLLAGITLYVGTREPGQRIPVLPLISACDVRTPSGSVTLDPTQMANAATIAAVGIRRKVPDQAVVIALAAALQESKLENLDAGDRDSVGLFQQRPSQGWGTPEQIQDPRYSAGKFYTALLKVKGWQELRVTEAAQRVQRSAFPEAYEKWSDEAGVLAEALGGRAPSAVSCNRVGEPDTRGPEAATALGADLRLDWGNIVAVSDPAIVGLIVSAANERTGWQYAHWLVSHSMQKSVERVRYGGLEWTSDSGEWSPVAASPSGGSAGADTGQVIAEVYRA